MTDSNYSTVFHDPKNHSLIGIIQKESGGGFTVFRGAMDQPPAFSCVEDVELAEKLVLADNYDIALQIYRQALEVT